MPSDKQPTAAAPHRRPAGAAAAALNALRHGLRARFAVLPGESRAAFSRLLRRFAAYYRPADTHQQLLVEQMAIAYWKLARIGRIEALVYRNRSESDTLFPLLRQLILRRFDEDEDEDDDNDNGNGEPEPQPDDEPVKPPPSPDELIAMAFMRDTSWANTFARLSHYEMRLERSFHRAYRELRRLQSSAPSAPSAWNHAPSASPPGFCAA